MSGRFLRESAEQPEPKRPSRGLAGRAIGGSFILLLKGLFWVFAILLPLISAWIASSLAAYQNGPRWLVLLTAVVLFPLVPLAWEAWSAHRRRQTISPGPRVLTFGDRILLRTLASSGLFLLLLLAIKPEAGVRAILARGDWMLDGATSPTAETARRALFWTADGFEWIYRWARVDAIEEGDDGARPKDDGKPAPQPLPNADEVTKAPKDGEPEPQPAPAPPPPPPDLPKAGGKLWPTAATLHPAVASVPEPHEASIASLGRYLTDKEPDLVLRAKAVHDWVADRVSYDMVALRSNDFPSQRADDVFRTRMAVCAGYSNLFVALARAAGLEAEYVVGDAKGAGGEVDGRGHAWNAVKLGGEWYLVDVTWNAGGVRSDGQWYKDYSTPYLFVPPEVMINDHIPDDDKWQLMGQPVSKGDFMRRPQLKPSFAADGFRLESPTRSQTNVGRVGEIVIANPEGRFMLASYSDKGETGERQRCEVEHGPTIRVRCDFRREGEYRVLLFGSPVEYGKYHWLGELQMLSSGR